MSKTVRHKNIISKNKMAVLKSIVTLFVICLTFLIPIVNCQELQQRKQGSLCSEAFVQINANINTTYIRRTKSNNTCTFYFALDFGHLTDMEVLVREIFECYTKSLYLCFDTSFKQYLWSG